MDLKRSEALFKKLLFLTETWFICDYMENKTKSVAVFFSIKCFQKSY